ncbi:hypothetical protein U1701_05830 [Sphingomonas sp. PB2P19]|uniref:hypothetical protein n=1 Tax=Sphingomonas rhamnosi TaxID=3096156 RepID=UPI002FC7A61E
MRIAAALAAVALLASPAAAQQPCITGPEAEALTLVALPDIIRETGTVCAAQLPATSLVRRRSSPLLSRYQVEAARAWPAARAAIVKLSDPAVDALLDSEFARPLLTSLLVPQLVGRIATRDCGTIDRLVALLEPLPARNTAAIVVETLRYLKAEKARRGVVAVPDLPLCTARSR